MKEPSWHRLLVDDEVGVLEDLLVGVLITQLCLVGLGHSPILICDEVEHENEGVRPDVPSSSLLRMIQVVQCPFQEYDQLFIGQVSRTPAQQDAAVSACLLYTSPSPRDATLSRMPSSA